MKIGNDTFPIATAIVGLAFLLVTIIGGVVVIVHPSTLSFATYCGLVVGLAGSAGLLGVGRGIAAGAEARANAQARVLGEAATTVQAPPPPPRTRSL